MRMRKSRLVQRLNTHFFNFNLCKGIRNVLNITVSGCLIVQQAFVGERKSAAEGPLNALQSFLEYIKLNLWLRSRSRTGTWKVSSIVPFLHPLSQVLIVQANGFQCFCISGEQWQSISTDSMTKNDLQKCKELIRATVYIMSWVALFNEAFPRVTVVLLARSCPR